MLKVQEVPTTNNGQQEMVIPSAGENASTSLMDPNAGPTKRGEDQAWHKVIGKSASRSRERQVDDTVNIINGFNILTESRLQLTVQRQIEEGPSRQRSNIGAGWAFTVPLYTCMKLVTWNIRGLNKTPR